jgi:hypothetical protein
MVLVFPGASKNPLNLGSPSLSLAEYTAQATSKHKPQFSIMCGSFLLPGNIQVYELEVSGAMAKSKAGLSARTYKTPEKKTRAQIHLFFIKNLSLISPQGH